MKKGFLLSVLFVLLASSCTIMNSGDLQDESVSGTDVSAVIISDEAFKDQVPEEDIAEFRAIQRDIAAQYPMDKTPSSEYLHTKAVQTGVNPTEAQIIAAFNEAYKKYNIPVEILYGIAKGESSLKQYKSTGQPLISGDDGIGIMQVTPAHVDIAFDRNKLMWDYKYNIEAGAQVILSKWKYVSKRNPIGDNNIKVLENWYLTVWAYNGYSKINNPNEYRNGPRTWTSGTFTWTRTEAYEDTIYGYIKARFNLAITKIPASLLPLTGIPASGKSFATPTPFHFSQYDAPVVIDFPGSHVNPYLVNSLPYTKSSTTLDKESRFNNYPPYTQNESGPEEVYKLTILNKGTLTIVVSNSAGIDTDVHLLSALDSAKCVSRHDTTLSYIVEPGTYYVIADTYKTNSFAGNYTISMSLLVEGSFSSPYSISAFPFTRTSTTINKEKLIASYPPFTQNESGPEEYYQLTVTQPSRLIASVQSLNSSDIDIQLLSNKNSSSCVSRNDTAVQCIVMPGTWYIACDTYNGDANAGNYTLNVDLKPLVAGSYDYPYSIGRLPYTNNSTTAGKESLWNSYPVFTANESGPEEYYMISIVKACKLTVKVTDPLVVDIDIHLLNAKTNTACVARNDGLIQYSVTPGTWYITCDTFGGPAQAGTYTLTVTTN